MAKSVFFQFGQALTGPSPQSIGFQFIGFPFIVYTCVNNNPGPYEYRRNTSNYLTAGPQVAAEIEARMLIDIGADYDIERQSNKLRISKKDGTDLTFSQAYNATEHFKLINNPEEVWDFNDLEIVLATVNLNQVTVLVSGTNRPIQFKLDGGAWMAGDTELEKLFTNVPAGLRTIYVNDGFHETSIQVNVLTLVVTYVKTNPTIYGGADGAIDVTVTGGNPPYSFSWLDGPDTEDREGLQAGNYRLVISDDSNDVRVLEITLENPGSPTYSVEILNLVIRPRVDEAWTAAAYIFELQLKISVNDMDDQYSLDGNYRQQGGQFNGFGSKDFVQGFNQDNYLEKGFDQVVELHFGDYENKFDPNVPDRAFEFQFLIDDHIADGVINYTSPILIWRFVESNTGYKAWLTLEQYRADTGELTGLTKDNLPGDPDYVAPVLDPDSCPLL